MAAAVAWHGAGYAPPLLVGGGLELSLVLRKSEWFLIEMYVWELITYKQIHKQDCDDPKVFIAQH